MRARLLRILALAVLSAIALVCFAIAGVYWRLSSGPISLASVKTQIEDSFNQNTPGIRIRMASALIEFEPDTFVPHVRFRNVVLTDVDNNLLAAAPRAAVTLDGAELLWGKVVPTKLELIGPSIRAQRNLDGTFELGTTTPADPNSEPVDIDFSAQDQLTPPVVQKSAGEKLIDLLADTGPTSPFAALQEIRVSKAKISLSDQPNEANWLAPSADVVFNRRPFGFVAVMTADIASSGDPWRAEMSVSYRRETQRFNIATHVSNLVPANVANQIYALSEFARVQVPLSGVVELELGRDGAVNSGSAELIAVQGKMSFPEYFAQPFAIDSGRMRLQYQPQSGQIAIQNSSLVTNGMAVNFDGSLEPKRDPQGKLEAVGIRLTAKTVQPAERNQIGEELYADNIEFAGAMAIEDRNLQIDDLVVMAGNTGLRLRGTITSGTNSAGLQLAGRLKDASAPFIKKYWPPIMAPNTLRWITTNLVSGRVKDGTFHVNFPVDALAQLKDTKAFVPGSVDVQLELADIETRYFRQLKALTNATGRAHVSDNSFELEINGGRVTLDSGEQLTMDHGFFAAQQLLADEVPGRFTFDISSSVQGLSQFLDQPDLAAFLAQKPAIPDIKGGVKAKLEIAMPLIRDVPRDRVQITTGLKLVNAEIANAMKGVNLTEGNFDVDFAGENVTVKGNARLNGLPASIDWSKPKNGGDTAIALETTLDAKSRDALDLKVNQFIQGPIPVKLKVLQGEGTSRIDLDADLSKVAINVRPLNWTRDPVTGTKLSLRINQNADGTRTLKDILISGEGLKIAGSVDLRANGDVKSAEFSQIKIADQSELAARIVPRDDGLDIRLAGYTLDARPYISEIISPANASAPVTKLATNLNVSATFEKIYAFRGEIIQNANATMALRGGKLALLSVNAAYANGQTLKIDLTPNATGRTLQISSTDGGSTLRAGNFYSKVAGGQLEFSAQIENAPGSPIRKGNLRMTNFAVCNEAALSELDRRGRPRGQGPRTGGINFKRLSLPFTSDANFVYLPDIELKGNDLGAVAKGSVRKANGGLAIGGTMIPAQGINGALDDIPLLGVILSGGNNEGVLGITFCMGGTIAKPKWQVNPMSFLAPGIFRKIFECQVPNKRQPDPRKRTPNPKPATASPY